MVNYEAKLKELLHRINSVEIKLCSDATKEFIKLLKGDSGGELLRQYVTNSSQCSELLGAWKLRQGKTGISCVFKLISAVLNHVEGRYRPNDKNGITISRVLDKFARLIIEEHLQDVYKEINSREVKSQKAALLLMASIVRRGSVLASDTAKSFDFKLKGFANLAGFKKRRDEKRVKRSPRKAFVRFAMSFLEAGKPGLLRWVLQQKEMYSGVLRALGNEEEDDDETVVYVLSTLRDRVLVEESMVPPGLRSVLFGSATLEQLVEISGRENGGYASELAYNVLLLVCTDPRNGLMPDLARRPSPLRGNPRRLLGLMKKLKATEVVYHRDLLLGIVRGRPSFGAAYMEEFPYSLEDFSSPNWFAIVTLAAKLLSSVGEGLDFNAIVSKHHELDLSSSASLESLMKCLFPRSFSQSVITRGLLHSDILVKHGTLRLLLEALKLLGPLIGSLDIRVNFHSDVSLKHEIQNAVRTSLPDPQVLVTLLSSLSSQSKTRDVCLKRKMEPAKSSGRDRDNRKRLKKEKLVDNDSDIVIGGISNSLDDADFEDNEKVGNTTVADDFDSGKEFEDALHVIWGSVLCEKDAEIYFQSKLLDALKTYFKIMPAELEKLFMFLMKLLKDPLALHINLQQSLLSYLVECVRWSPTGSPLRVPPLMYKHLQSFINLLILSPISNVKSKAYDLARAAMSSTGAFDKNPYEIGSWFLFLPGYDRRKSASYAQGLEKFQSCQVVKFFCDAISTMGNSLFKFWDAVKSHACSLNVLKDASPGFSPLVVCILQKCLRLLDSKSEAGLPEKSMISLYVSNTLKYIMQTQVDARLLSSVIVSILSERLCETNSIYDDSESTLCEWRPLKNLLSFSRSILNSQTCVLLTDKNAISAGGSALEIALIEVERSLGSSHGSEVGDISDTISTFSSSLICAMPEEIVKNLSSVMTTLQRLPGVLTYLMPSIFFLQQRLLTEVSHSWPEVYFAGLEMAVSRTCCHEDIKDDSLVAGEATGHKDFATTNKLASATAIVSFVLEVAPFHVLFPSVMSIDGPYTSDPMKMKDLLLAKLSGWKSDNSHLSYLCLLLFWIHQIQSSIRVSPSIKLEELSDICFILLKTLLVQLFESKAHSSQEIQEVVETIFCHPVVVTSISHPLDCDMGLEKANLVYSVETAINSGQGGHKLDQLVWDILGTTAGFLYSLCDDPRFETKAENGADHKLVKGFNLLMQRLFKEVEKKFKEGICSGGLMLLLPSYHALQAMTRFLSPFELLELVKWLFDEVEIDKLTVHESSKKSAVLFGVCIAVGAFRNLSSYLLQPLPKRKKYDMFWKIEELKDFNIVEEIYVRMTRIAVHFETDHVNVCLLEAANAAQRQKQMMHHNFHRLSLAMSRIVSKTSVEMLSHCIHRPTRTKAKLLFFLTDMSSFHLSKFGDLFLGVLNNDLLHRGKVAEEDSNVTLSDEDYMMLLPVALSYLNSTFTRFGVKYCKNINSIHSVYSAIFTKGFSLWRSFVSNEMFVEQYDNVLPASSQELVNLVNDSLLGNSIRMLQHCFAFEKDSMNLKKRLKLFTSIFPISSSPDDLLGCDYSALDSLSINESLNFINRLVGKISFCRMLLFPNCSQIQSTPKEDEDLKDATRQRGSTKEECSRMHFIKVLVDIWQLIIQKFPLVSVNSEKSPGIFSLYGYLENFILRSVLGLITDLRGIFAHQERLPFLEKLTKSALRYRYGDPATVEVLCGILSVLVEGKFARDFYLQLLLSHSQFESTIGSVSVTTRSWGIGAFLKPMPGILRYITFRTADENAPARDSNQLGIVKLLRTLLSFKPDQSALDFRNSLDIKFRRLHLLLLSSYGATLKELDLEIYNLLSAIESMDGDKTENIAGFDYLWGNAALKIEKEQAFERDTANITSDAEAIKERRRSQFRDNFPIDPKICASTVLYFPYDRTASPESASFDKFQSITSASALEPHYSAVRYPERYDPVFILRFSLYCLSANYIEPMEFAGLGLLAIAFVSISSPDEVIRRLAYNTLEKFNNALKLCKNRKKDVTHIRLLLTSLQNGIEEPWQRVPSVVAVFAAEASFILLDSSHDHYANLSRYLMKLSKINMKNVPMFDDFFWSISVNFKTERLWILRLLYAGLNLDDDAQIYIRNSVFETLMGFYLSPLSEIESTDLILQVVKKSILSFKLTRHLVENCGLFSWLSHVLLNSIKMSSSAEREFSIRQLTLVLKIVNDVISLRNVNEWLQNKALEQLMELTSHLYRFLVKGVVSRNNGAKSVDFILEVIVWTLKLSHKRKIYQPHFNIPIEGLYRICEIINQDDCSDTRTSTFEFGLKAALMSLPSSAIFSMGQEKLQTFLVWAISSALRADSTKLTQNKASCQSRLSITSEPDQSEESLVSKLLRWLAASVIQGNLDTRSNSSDPKGSSLKDLMTSSESSVKTAWEKNSRNDDIVNCEEFVASAILFLQQRVSTNYDVLPSVVSALSILLRNVLMSDDDRLHGHKFRSYVESLWSKVRCVAEANPAWRWTFYQPWKDNSLEQTDSEKIDEIHASQSILFVVSNVLCRSESVQQITDFEWENHILVDECNHE